MSKRELWTRIQHESPDLAEVLKEINRVFGKPEKVIYEHSHPQVPR